MTDVFSPEKRSWVMSRIRSKNTSIDLQMKSLLSKNDWDFEMYPKMQGNPDFIIGERKIAIFCDGDFWHGYRYFKKKKMKKKYWRDKIEENMKRDRRTNRRLRADGWKVLRFWEHDLKKKPEHCLEKIIKFMS